MQIASIRSWALRSAFLSAVGVSLCFCSFAKPDPTGRIVKYSQQDIIQVRVKLRFSTLIILPQDEEILDFATGDREFWIINGVHNLCYVHPAQTAIRSDLHLITSSGRVYSFLLTEISNEPNAEPDLKLFVEPKEQSTIAGAASLQGFVRVSEVEAYRKELEAAREQAAEQIRTAGIKAAEDISKFRADYAGKLQFDYDLDRKASAEPFLVSAIYHDDTFTYIRCAAREKPSLYEIKDGKPNLINFQLEDGVYIVPKILDNAYLTIGKKKLAFTRKS